jgi:hypothetical protein
MDNQKVNVISTSKEFFGGLPYTPCFVEWLSDGHYKSGQLHNLSMTTRISGWYGLILIVLWHWLGNVPIPMSTVWYSDVLMFRCISFCGYERCWLYNFVRIKVSCFNESSHLIYSLSCRTNYCVHWLALMWGKCKTLRVHHLT